MNPLSDFDLNLLGYLLRSDSVDRGFLRWELGSTEQEIENTIQRLNSAGCLIDPFEISAYRLIRADMEIWEDYLTFTFRRAGIQIAPIRVYRKTGSTQDAARHLQGRALILADHQTDGRGRLGRRWIASPGVSVLLSLVWPAVDSATLTHDRISIIIGVALARLLERYTPTRSIRLKWPNDLLIDNRKLAGVLIERSNNSFVIGIGLNIHHDPTSPADIAARSCSLESVGFQTHRLRVIEDLIVEIDLALRTHRLGLLLDEWRNRSSLGHEQSFMCQGQMISGTVLDIDPDAGLIVRRDTGELIHLPAATTSVIQ